jgi:hypothetical protein
MRNIWIVIVSAGFVSLAACSSGLSEEDTRVAWAATNLALTQGQAQAQAAASGVPLAPGPETDEIRPRVAAQVDFTWSCPEGGTARYAGSAETVSDAGGSDVSFDLATDFDACGVSGVAISGSLDYSAAVSTSAGSTATTLTMKGNLSFEGKVEGGCEIDMTSKVSVTGGSVSVSYDGSICGNSASATLNVQG